MNQLVLHNSLVSYTTLGSHKEGGAPALLFLHGWRSQGSVWATLMRYLTVGQKNVFTLDLPGFGSSPAPQTSWQLKDYAAVVSDFVAKLNVTEVILIGHSFGGRIALKIAAEHPPWLKKLVLIGVPGIKQNTARTTMLAAVAKVARPIFKIKKLQNLRKKIYEFIGASDYVETPELRRIFLNIINEDLQPLLSTITTPTLLVWGANDAEVPAAVGKAMERILPSAHYKEIHDAGHFCFIDNPQECAAVLNAFI